MAQVPVSYTIGVIRYAITNVSCTRADAERWGAAGVDFVQLRDRTVPAGALVDAARMLVKNLAPHTRLLINGRADVALAARAAGVHLTAHPDELTPAQVRTLFALANAAPPAISVSCHTLQQVAKAHTGDADLILFGPVFEKRVHGEWLAPGAGLSLLRLACAEAPGKVLALGGVTAENIPLCLDVGAAGVAGIRLFDAAATALSPAG